MSFVLFLIFTLTVVPLIIWGIMHEDMLIKIEDKVVKDIRSQIAENRRNKNIKVVKDGKSEPARVSIENNVCNRGYVA